MSDARANALQIGTRVTVRHRIDDDSHSLTDALGEVVALDDAAVMVRTRRGDVRISLAAVVAVRQVPPAPPRRAPRQPPQP
ncbi:putative acetyltransferase [Serinibacter arcticus]|uniref:Histone acetyltransferase Rv0428c-like SH3 domain-containing protein n=1 Tax=Serinibacter arcticus TaxID=1655435 RepID=A0A4Z1E377_9MICO|nr:hypothetical protein [Serinibacter arcticus]TGO04121.1 hypothetical protein SERN_2712 [Serinibacter arcticus]